ncbi:MAG: shikimate kinase, partial [Phycisphaerae bacterium]
MNIVLIGHRACGKTTVGRALAQRLGRPFVDTDELVTAAAGRTVRDIFEQEGEAGFRSRERAAVVQATSADASVIAVGGGAV